MCLKLIENNVAKLRKFKILFIVEIVNRLSFIGDGFQSSFEKNYRILVWPEKDTYFTDNVIGKFHTFDHVGGLLFYINEVHQHLKTSPNKHKWSKEYGL